MDPILLDLKQAAATLAVDESTLLRWVRDGVCPPPMIVSGLPRWHRETLDRWAAGGCVTGEPPHHFIMHAARRGNMEDMGRRFDESIDKIRILEEMENEVS